MKIDIDGQAVFVGQGGTQWQENFPTLLLLHGAGLDRTVWVYIGRYFARRGYNVVIPDLPGHGLSEGALLNSIEANADWINLLMDTLTAETVLSDKEMYYCGHSMGSLVTMQAASTRDTPLTGLLLLGSAYPMAVGDALLSAAKKNEHAAIDMINLFGHSYASQLGNNPISGVSAYNSMEALLERAPKDVLFNDLNACNDYKDGENAASRLKERTPVSIIAGANDQMTPLKMCRGLQEMLGARLDVLKDCGHMMMSEQPEPTLQRMKQALPSR